MILSRRCHQEKKNAKKDEHHANKIHNGRRPRDASDQPKLTLFHERFNVVWKHGNMGRKIFRALSSH